MEPFFYVARMTDNRVTDSSVTVQQENSAEAWLGQYDASLMEPLMRYQLKDEDSFPAHLFQEPAVSMSPKK